MTEHPILMALLAIVIAGNLIAAVFYSLIFRSRRKPPPPIPSDWPGAEELSRWRKWLGRLSGDRDMKR
jgi:hypothetical protein